jgi:hypothetical protein
LRSAPHRSRNSSTIKPLVYSSGCGRGCMISWAFRVCNAGNHRRGDWPERRGESGVLRLLSGRSLHHIPWGGGWRWRHTRRRFGVESAGRCWSRTVARAKNNHRQLRRMYGSFAVDYAAPAETIFRGDDETKASGRLGRQANGRSGRPSKTLGGEILRQILISNLPPGKLSQKRQTRKRKSCKMGRRVTSTYSVSWRPE